VIYERDADESPSGTPPPRLRVVDSDGGNERVLELGCTDPCAGDLQATWTPTAGRIAYARVVGPFDGPGGSGHRRGLRGLRPLLAGRQLPRLHQGPERPLQQRRVAFGHGAPKGKTQNVATVPANCASPRKCRKRIRFLTHLRRGPGARFNPTWSPNGKRIAYTRFKGDEKKCCVGDIYKMRPDGTHRRAVLTSKLFEFRPDWGATR